MASFGRAVLGSLLFAATAIACGGAVAPGIGGDDAGPTPTTTSTTPPPPTTTGTPPPPKPPPPPDAGKPPYCPPLSDPSWTLTPDGYDASCAQDEDCAPAFFGTLACTDPKQALCTCPNAAIAKTSLGAYQAAAAALDTQCKECRPAGSMMGCLCPAFKTRCNSGGTCVLCLTGDTGCGL